jgi:hypothetical protein
MAELCNRDIDAEDGRVPDPVLRHKPAIQICDGDDEPSARTQR